MSPALWSVPCRCGQHPAAAVSTPTRRRAGARFLRYMARLGGAPECTPVSGSLAYCLGTFASLTSEHCVKVACYATCACGPWSAAAMVRDQGWSGCLLRYVRLWSVVGASDRPPRPSAAPRPPLPAAPLTRRHTSRGGHAVFPSVLRSVLRSLRWGRGLKPVQNPLGLGHLGGFVRLTKGKRRWEASKPVQNPKRPSQNGGFARVTHGNPPPTPTLAAA